MEGEEEDSSFSSEILTNTALITLSKGFSIILCKSGKWYRLSSYNTFNYSIDLCSIPFLIILNNYKSYGHRFSSFFTFFTRSSISTGFGIKQFTSFNKSGGGTLKFSLYISDAVRKHILTFVSIFLISL